MTPNPSTRERRIHRPGRTPRVTAVLVAVLLAVAGTLAADAGAPYWEYEVNREAARRSTRTGMAERRTEAVRTLSRRLGDIGLVGPEEVGAVTIDAVTAAVDGHGRVRNLAATGRALATRSGDEPLDLLVKRFVLDNPSIWGFEGSTLRHPEELTTLRLVSVEQLPTPGGRTVTVARFEQDWRGLPVIDGEVQAVLWGDQLVRITGTILNSAAPGKAAAARIGRDDAVVTAERHIAEQAHQVVSSEVTAFGLMASLDAVAYRLEVVVRDDAEDDVVESFSVLVDGHDGSILASQSNLREFSSRTGTYRVYNPDPAGSTPNATRLWDLNGGHVALNGSQVYPWRDRLTGATPVPVYDDTITWNNACWGDAPCKGFTWHSNASGYGFRSNPAAGSAGDDFRLQHVSYWMQRAVSVADANFRWWPPADRAYVDSVITAIVNRPSNGTAVAGINGCWGIELWRPSDGALNVDPRVQCIKFPVEGDTTYGPGDATRLGVIFHEVGHAIDAKYGAGEPRWEPIVGACTNNTAEEALSLSETVAGLYTQMTFMDIFGTGTAFTDADGSTGSGRMWELTGTNNFPAHLDDTSLVCHAPSGTTCARSGPRPLYSYGNALLQAYWEIAHGLNCDGPAGEACSVMADGAGAAEARWALFYALRMSPRNASYRDFVANILEFFYHDVGYNAWASRWWVFNHHDLVGPRYTYSPCFFD